MESSTSLNPTPFRIYRRLMVDGVRLVVQGSRSPNGDATCLIFGCPTMDFISKSRGDLIPLIVKSLEISKDQTLNLTFVLCS